MRRDLFSAVSFGLLVSFICTSSTPVTVAARHWPEEMVRLPLAEATFALKPQETAEQKTGLEELANAFKEWGGGPNIRLYPPGRASQDHRFVIHGFDPAGTQIWGRLTDRPKPSSAPLAITVTNSSGQLIPPENAIVLRTRVLHNILVQLERAGQIPTGDVKKIWLEDTGRVDFKNPKTLATLRLDAVKAALAENKETIVANRQQLSKPVEQTRPLVLALRKNPGAGNFDNAVFFYTAGDDRSQWGPIAEVFLSDTKDDAALVSFSALKSVRIDRESVYEDRRSGVGLEERVNLLVIRDSNDRATQRALREIVTGWAKGQTSKKVDVVPFGTLEKGLAASPKKGKWNGVLMFRRVATMADADELERQVTGLRATPDFPPMPVALVVYALDQKVFDDRLYGLLHRMKNEDHSIVTYFVHRLWEEQPSTPPVNTDLDAPLLVVEAEAPAKPAVPPPAVFTGVLDQLLDPATKYAAADSGLEELEQKLRRNLPTWTWSNSSMQISLEQRSDLLLRAKENTRDAFALGRAVAVAGHGKNSRIPKSWKDLSDYLESVLEKELVELIGDGGALADDSVLHQSPLPALGKPASAVDWIKQNVRFVAVNDDANGYLASQGVEAAGSHTAVVAYAGWFPYPQWETGLSPDMAVAIKNGMRARLQNHPLRPDELPGPPSVYLSRTQIQEFMKGGDEGRRALAIKLAHEVKDILRQGRHEDESPALTQQVNGFINQHMHAIRLSKQEQAQARQDREERKLTKFHVTADLSALLSGPANADQRLQIVQSVQDRLQEAQKAGTLFGFNVYLFNQGKMLVVDLDYKEGAKSKQRSEIVSVVKKAVTRGLFRAQSLGLAQWEADSDPLSKVNLHAGENQLTQRASEPIVTVQAIGLGMGAFNRVIWQLLVGDVGHLQAVGGERGFRVVVANLSDIREGKKQYRTYEYEVPGISEEKVKEIIRKIQANEMTEEDLKDEASRNLHQLHRLIGAMDEYAIEGVYPLAGSRFAAKEGKEMVTLTDEPIIKVHLHENPQGDFRGQSGAWATGSYQKVLTMPHFGPNAEQTRWVGMIPVTLREAEDLSALEKEDWPVREMGFMTAWAWSYDRGGTGRGEPPVTDVFGKNNQAQINREVLKPLMEVWKGLANFEPRLTAEEAARRASTAAAQFPFVEKAPEGTLSTGVWHAIPDLKKGEADPIVQRFQGDDKLTWSFFKADIGGKAGHDQVLQTHMAAARAKLEEAKEQGLIQDFKVFFVGDDMQLAILHKNGVQSEKMHALAWQVFSFGYWVSYTIDLEPYGHAQDIRVAELFHKFPIEHHAQLSRRAVELLKIDFEQAVAGQADVPDVLKANAQAALSSALSKWELLEGSLKKWETGATAGTVVTEAVSVGNVTGMGIGWAEQPVGEGMELAYYGLDKSGAGGFNTRLASMMADALVAGDLRFTDIVEMWDVEQHRRIFLQVGDHMDQILDMAAQVNKFNFKRILDAETGNIFGWLSSEILAQTAHGYVGKDDPILLMIKRVGHHLAGTFRDPLRAATAQLGDEAGTHNLANVLRAWWESFPGEKSNPVGAAITFRIRNGQIEMEDEGSKPEYDDGRVAAEGFNRMLVGVQGEFSPQVANRRQVEPTYPRARMLDEADKNPTAWVDRVDFMVATGLEEGALSDAFLREVVSAGDFYKPFPQADGSRFVVVPADMNKHLLPRLYLQAGLANPLPSLASAQVVPLPADLEGILKPMKTTRAGDLIVLNSEVVGSNPFEWLIGAHAQARRIRISPELAQKFSQGPTEQFLEVVAAAVRVRNGLLLLDYTYKTVDEKRYLILRSA